VSGKRPRVTLITGGAGQIARAIGGGLADAGSCVILVDVDEVAGQRAAEDLRRLGGEAHFVKADVASSRELAACVANTVALHGRIDGFVNNAGIQGPISDLVDYSEEEFDHVWTVNARGCFLGLKHVLPAMREQGSGSIVNMSSVAGVRGLSGFAGYVAAKHAVIGLTRVAALEAARFGVRVNAVCPGPTSGRMMSAIETAARPDDPARAAAKYRAAIPLGRYATDEEVAGVVLFLLASTSSFVTGAVWAIDGGMSAT